MKKTIFFFIIIVTALGLNAQEQQYTRKLDSVVGSDNFGWNHWKIVYAYPSESEFTVSEEIHYDWENQAWVPNEKIETSAFEDEALVQTNAYRWTGEEWKLYRETLRQYNVEDPQQLQHVVVFNVNDTIQERYRYTTYEYDELNRLTLVMDYNGTDTAWIENSKYEYVYNAEGLVDTCLYSTIRNGSWRESERTVYFYNGNQQCDSLLAQRKGGWGPFGNNWMDSYRYEFEYEDGALAAEYYYASSGWFGGELSLNSKVEYNFDALGNLLSKTASIFNGEDWIVRDVYENQYDLTVDASKVLGLEQFWKSTIDKGMGFVLGDAMPLNNLWLSCSIASSELDTQFTLFCSGFAGVEENELGTLQAYCNGGNLVAVSEQPSDITVFDLLGRKVASKAQVERCEFSLTSGLYLVSNGIQTIKVSVR